MVSVRDRHESSVAVSEFISTHVIDHDKPRSPSPEVYKRVSRS